MRIEENALPRKRLSRIKASINAELLQYSPSARKIIIAAQRLFAERGIDGISLREIASSAGHANNSAVQYHFQSKEGLIQAIFELRVPFLEETRQSHLQSLDSRGNILPEDLLAALLLPFLEMSDDDQEQRIFALFCSHLLSRDPDDHPFRRAQEKMPVSAHIYQALGELLAHLPKQVFDFRLRLVAGFFLSTILERQNTQRAMKPSDCDDSLFWGDMVNMLAAMLREPFRAEKRMLNLG
jgi:AcrR family transcriptional regulator